MSSAMIRRVKERRDDVHRRIGELRAELGILEARADEIERIWKGLIDDEKEAVTIPPGTYVSPPNIAYAEKTSVGELILLAITELEGAGYEHADRKSIFSVVARAGYSFKSNTLRVALRRLVKAKRVCRLGDLYSSVPESEAAASDKAAA